MAEPRPQSMTCSPLGPWKLPVNTEKPCSVPGNQRPRLACYCDVIQCNIVGRMVQCRASGYTLFIIIMTDTVCCHKAANTMCHVPLTVISRIRRLTPPTSCPPTSVTFSVWNVPGIIKKISCQSEWGSVQSGQSKMKTILRLFYEGRSCRVKVCIRAVTTHVLYIHRRL